MILWVYVISRLKVKMKIKFKISNKGKYTFLLAVAILMISIVYVTSLPSTYGHSANELEGACGNDGRTTGSVDEPCLFLDSYASTDYVDNNLFSDGFPIACSHTGWFYEGQTCNTCISVDGFCDLGLGDCACNEPPDYTDDCCVFNEGDYCIGDSVEDIYCVNGVITGTKNVYIDCHMSTAPAGYICVMEQEEG